MKLYGFAVVAMVIGFALIVLMLGMAAASHMP